MDKEEYIAWENKKSDLSIKISELFASEKLKSLEGICVLMHCLTTGFVSIKLQIGEEAANEAFDCFLEDVKEEYKAKMEYFKDKHDIGDVLAEIMFHQVMKGKE